MDIFFGTPGTKVQKGTNYVPISYSLIYWLPYPKSRDAIASKNQWVVGDWDINDIGNIFKIKQTI